MTRRARAGGGWRWIPVTAVLATALSTASAGHAQAVVGHASIPESGAVLVGATLEPELVVSIGYLHRIDAGTGPGALAAGVGLEIPPYLLGAGSGRLNLIAAGEWFDEAGWGVTASSAGYVARVRNRAGTMHGFGTEVRVAPGYRGSTWSVAADLGWQGTLATHIRHSALVRATYGDRYPGGEDEGPVDGWYGLTAQRFRAGVVGAARLRDGLSIRLAAGGLFARQKQGLLVSFAHGQVPVYLEASMKASGG